MPDPETAPVDAPDQQPNEPAAEATEPDCSKFPPPGECNTGVDDLACTAKGDDAKAEYNKTFVEKLRTAKGQYDTTREAYRTERDKARSIVEDLRNQIRHLVERIGCQIEQKRVRKCLDDAFCDVLDELECCPKEEGCCVGECEFDLEGIEDMSVEELTALITSYQARTDEAEKCFTKLIKEPAELADRVEKAKKAIADINTALGGDAATLNLKKVYADALVARWKVDAIWGGFDQRQEFVDCLCDALTCWTKGCQAVYQLKGAEAIAKCREQARKDRCDLLRSKTAEQILAGYDRRCAKTNCEEPPPGTGETPKDEDDCGCRKHHHHHHHHKHHHDCDCHRHDCDCHRHDCDCHRHDGCDEADEDDPPKKRDCGCA